MRIIHMCFWLAMMTQTGWFLFFSLLFNMNNAVSELYWQISVQLTAKKFPECVVITTKDWGLVPFHRKDILANHARHKEAIGSWGTEGKQRLSWPLNDMWKIHILVSFLLCPVLTFGPFDRVGSEKECEKVSKWNKSHRNIALKQIGLRNSMS